MMVPVDVEKYTEHLMAMNKFYSESLNLFDTETDKKKAGLVKDLQNLLQLIQQKGKAQDHLVNKIFKATNLNIKIEQPPEPVGRLLNKRQVIRFTNPDGETDTVYLDLDSAEYEEFECGGLESPKKRSAHFNIKEEYYGESTETGPKEQSSARKIPKFWINTEPPQNQKPSLLPEVKQEILKTDMVTTRRQKLTQTKAAKPLPDPIKDILKGNSQGTLVQRKPAKQSFEMQVPEEPERKSLSSEEAKKSSEEESEDSEEDETYEPEVSRRVDQWVKREKTKQSSSNSAKGRPRGSYNMLNLDQRITILNYASRHGVDAAHEKYKICKSRIRRYIHHGADRKKGGGRKTLDPHMETNLLNWIEKSSIDSKSFPSRCLIKEKAKDLSRVGNFLASKGWCDKFFKRNCERLEKIRKGVH